MRPFSCRQCAQTNGCCQISTLSRYAQRPQHLSDPIFQDDLLPPLRNLASFALSLRSSFLTTLKLLSPWLKRLYGGTSSFLADAISQEGFAALSSLPARSARLIRKRVNVLVQVGGLLTHQLEGARRLTAFNQTERCLFPRARYPRERLAAVPPILEPVYHGINDPSPYLLHQDLPSSVAISGHAGL